MGILDVIVLVAVVDTICFVGLVLYLIRCMREPIRSRGWVLAVLGQMAFIVSYTISALSSQEVGQTNCSISYIVLTITMPSFLLPYTLRGKLLYNRYRYNVKMLGSVEEKRSDWWYYKYRIITKNWFVILTYFIICILNWAIVGLVLAFSPIENDTDECNANNLIYISFSWAAAILIGSLVILYKSWKHQIQDAYGFKHELKAFICAFPLLFIVFLVLYSINRDRTEVPTIILLALNGIYCSFISMYYPFYLTFQKTWKKSFSSTDNDSKNTVHPYDYV